MAQTKKGQKFNRVPGYVRRVKGKKIRVRTHDRSNPTTSTGSGQATSHSRSSRRSKH